MVTAGSLGWVQSSPHCRESQVRLVLAHGSFAVIREVGPEGGLDAQGSALIRALVAVGSLGGRHLALSCRRHSTHCAKSQHRRSATAAMMMLSQGGSRTQTCRARVDLDRVIVAAGS